MTQMGPYGSMWAHMDPYVPIWVYIFPDVWEQVWNELCGNIEKFAQKILLGQKISKFVKK